jgi:hypothetical protein
MITVAIFNSIVVFFASLAKSQKSDYWLKLSFILIFLFLALRYDYGNDYMGYLDDFLSREYLDMSSQFEIGWQILCLLFKPVGFFYMVGFLAAINCMVYYRFIKKYVSSSYYWLAVLIFVFDPHCMLILSSAMRQSVAVMIFVYSIDYLYKKDLVRYVLCIGMASMFHTSALVLLPLYLLSYFDIKLNNFYAVVLYILYLTLFIYLPLLLPAISEYINLYFKGYNKYEFSGNFTLKTGFGYLFYLFLYWLILYYAKSKNENSVFFYLAILSLFVGIIASFNTIFDRLTMYLMPAFLVVYSIIYSHMKYKRTLPLIIAGHVVLILINFYLFFINDTWSLAFSEYKSIFISPKIY